MGGKVWPGILAPNALQHFASSQSKSAVNSLHLSTVPAVPSRPGHWQAGSSGLAGCEEWWHISLHPCSRLTQRKVWLALHAPDSQLSCSVYSRWANWRLGVMGMP